jgi:hypothetical protein
VLNWLTCVECGPAELSFVVDSLGRTVIPLLDHALAGTDTAYRANLAYQFGTAYDRRPTAAFTRDEYIARFISNYEATVQRRAAVALGELGARAILERALADRLQNYRPDVIRSIRRALARTGDPQVQQQPDTMTVEIVPGDILIREGEATTLAAVVRDENGTEVPTTVTWASSEVNVATADPQPGQQAVVTGLAAGTSIITVTTGTGEQASATVTVLAAPPADLLIEYVSGSAQAGPVNTTLARPLVVRVMDTSGTEQSGVQIDWSFPDGGGTFTATNTETATSTTGGNGTASIQVRLGPTPRLISVNASIGGDPVRFRLRAN